jgi:predicted RNA-binding Zn-ribbon protein involved in translation (DUF1610 family)
MGDREDCPECGKEERKEALSIFRELWSEGNSALHRMYSSWEELEKNVELKTEVAAESMHVLHPCPYCGVKQRITKPLNGVFPYQNCLSCKRPFYIHNDLTIRKLGSEEKSEIPGAWIQVVDDLAKKKIAVVFRME